MREVGGKSFVVYNFLGFISWTLGSYGNGFIGWAYKRRLFIIDLDSISVSAKNYSLPTFRNKLAVKKCNPPSPQSPVKSR
jgi:hypothetical protein